MDITEEMISKAKAAASAAELQKIAKEYSIELSDADAAAYFAFFNGSGMEDDAQELSAEEMEMVAGGKGDGPAGDESPKFSVGQTVIFTNGVSGTIVSVHLDNDAYNWKYDIRMAIGGIVLHDVSLESPGCPVRAVI